MSEPTWIFCAGTYRSGSTTQYRITRDIVESTKNGRGIGYHTEDKLKEHDLEAPFDFRHRATIDFPEWLGDLDKWKTLGALVSRFEIFTQDLEHEVERIADYINVPLPPASIKEIAKRHTIEGIKEYKRLMRDQKKKEDPHLPAIPGILFGKPNVYQDHLTPQQTALMKQHNGNWMMRWGYL